MNKWADLSVRAGSAIVLAPLVIAAVWFGEIWFTFLCAGLGVVMAYEWTGIAHPDNSKQFALHVLATLAAVLLVGKIGINGIIIVLVIFWVVSLVLSRRSSPWAIVGVPYVALPILAFMILRNDAPWGFAAVIWCVAIVWAADILAYFAGRLIGGPKLVPRLSPKKTWAGLAGAVVGAGLASVVFSKLVHVHVWPLLGLAALLALAEQAGDIFESAFKRAHDVKDSSDIIPGHGGVLDRVDGLIIVIILAALVGLSRDSNHVAAGLLVW